MTRIEEGLLWHREVSSLVDHKAMKRVSKYVLLNFILFAEKEQDLHSGPGHLKENSASKYNHFQVITVLVTLAASGSMGVLAWRMAVNEDEVPWTGLGERQFLRPQLSTYWKHVSIRKAD